MLYCLHGPAEAGHYDRMVRLEPDTTANVPYHREPVSRGSCPGHAPARSERVLGADSAEGSHFQALTRSIVFQQLSGKAASTILSRVTALFPGGVPTPEAVQATSDEHIATIAWRPGTAEVGVLFHGDRLELWDAGGARRTVTLPAAPPSSDRYATLAFRVDGKAVVISRQSGVEGSTDTYAVAVDLASGRSVAIPVAGNGPIAGTSVRIGAQTRALNPPGSAHNRGACHKLGRPCETAIHCPVCEHQEVPPRLTTAVP